MTNGLEQLKNISKEIDIKSGFSPLSFRENDPQESQLPALRIITDKIEQQEKVMQEISSALYNLFKYSQIGICSVGVDGYFLEVNDAWCKLTRRSREELLTLRWQDITLPQFIEEDEQYVAKLISGEIPTYTMYKEYFYEVDGIKFPIALQLTVSCVFDRDRQLLYFISQAIDIEAVCQRYRKECNCGK